MNFIAFPVGSTNIFPLANSSKGGQLLSEFNIRSRESIETPSSVKYFIGKSFTHSADDFAIVSQEQGYSADINSTSIQIQPGRALINGHYVELLTPINIDLSEVNYAANREGVASLKGELAVGLRMMYSTYQTLAGSALIENSDDYYDGVQVVILPKESVKLPTDVPSETDFNKVNMHLLLGTFLYRNGVIRSVVQNEDKIRSIDAERISNISKIVSDKYITKDGLDPNKLYIFSGKGTYDAETGQVVLDGRDTWCDATDSLMIWDNVPSTGITPPSVTEATFRYNSNLDRVELVLPHKQVDGMVNTQGQSAYYQDKHIYLPSADIEGTTGGVVTPKYTKRIKEIDTKVDNLYNLPSGKMRQFIELLTDRDDLPEIPMVGSTYAWDCGDFILTGQDETVDSTINGRFPSTMYIIQPGYIKKAAYNTESLQVLRQVVPLDTYISLFGSDHREEAVAAYNEDVKRYQQGQYNINHTVASTLSDGNKLASYELEEYPSDPQNLNPADMWSVTSYRGRVGLDYFMAMAVEPRTDPSDPSAPAHPYDVTIPLPEGGEATVTVEQEHWHIYYFTPTESEPYSYSAPVWITGGVPFATETSIGGFVNVPDTAYGNGYVRMNENGYLQLMDYELLLTGVLAYQLGEDHSEGSGLSVESLQSVLEENINDRVCFPNATQRVNAQSSGADPNIIHLYLTLPEESGTLIIHDIGSRYGSSLYVHIAGSATSATTVIFNNCDKLRIDSNISGAPTILLNRVNLYYDPQVLDRVSTISNLSLWYERYSVTDPNIEVDGMTVTLIGKIESSETIDPWTSTYANDNHYMYALRSLTFANDGSVINVGMLVGDSTTANIDTGKSVFVSEFTLPQSVGLGYPSTRMTHPIKISGTFVSQYYLTDERKYMMKSTDFSALTQVYNRLTGSVTVKGTIAFYTDAEVVSSIAGLTDATVVDCWALNTPHFFTGGIVE